jgi:hypothetical protein
LLRQILIKNIMLVRFPVFVIGPIVRLAGMVDVLEPSVVNAPDERYDTTAVRSPSREANVTGHIAAG